MLFSPGEIEAVKRSVDLVGLVRSSGVDLEKKGKNWVGKCPFHNDQNPSLIVSPDKGLWNCLGACRNNGHPSGGDAIGWLVRRKGQNLPNRILLAVFARRGCKPVQTDGRFPWHCPMIFAKPV